MIFSEQWINLSLGRPGSGNIICVYRGEQPSIEEYLANYNTLYNFESSNILQLIIKEPVNEIRIITNPENPQYTQGLKSFNSGIATWASIHYFTNARAQYNIAGYYEISDSVVDYIQDFIANNGISNGSDGLSSHEYMTIVPVSSLSDNGVIKFLSTSFSHPDEADENRAIDMSIIASARS